MRAVGGLAADGVSSTVDLISDVHESIIGEVERRLPPPARVVTRLISAAARTTYAVVDLTAGFVLRAGTHLMADQAAAPTPSRTEIGRAAQPILNGLWGDWMAVRRPMLALPMAVRVSGDDVPPQPASLASAFPGATDRLVVFVHGLFESDRSWEYGQGEARTSFGERLRTELGTTPIYLRYNSGLAAGENGRMLAHLLEAVCAAWPVPVRRIDLVGHSMGGLVARATCQASVQADLAWVNLVDKVITLGTPHGGAPVAKAVPVGEWLLTQFPQSTPFARVLSGRSIAIKGLAHGVAVGPSDAPLPRHIAYQTVAASLTRQPHHPAGWLVGDGMVRQDSALGTHRTCGIEVDPAFAVRIGGVGHQGLLRHPAVYDQLRGWLVPPADPGALGRVRP
jgi:pimeloyl-ACP methyl ester carboxylesterase